MLCFVAGATANFYARPIEGVTMVVDLDRMAIVGYRDRVAYPVPKAEGTDYRTGKAGRRLRAGDSTLTATSSGTRSAWRKRTLQTLLSITIGSKKK